MSAVVAMVGQVRVAELLLIRSRPAAGTGCGSCADACRPLVDRQWACPWSGEGSLQQVVLKQ
jgi:bacterioferritin-associated ferredoxin